MKSNLADVSVRLVHETEKAYLVESVDTGVEAWIPKFQGELEMEQGDMGTLTLKQSLAEDKRLV